MNQLILQSARLHVTAQPLDTASFAPFGEVLGNRSENRRQDYALQFATDPVKVRQQLWVNRLPQWRGGPVTIDIMERHPWSAQTFVPMRSGRCLIVVAPAAADGSADLTGLSAFVSDGLQGVTYRPDIWHYTFTSLDGPNEVVVLMGYCEQGGDTVVENISRPVTVGAVNDVQGATP